MYTLKFWTFFYIYINFWLKYLYTPHQKREILRNWFEVNIFSHDTKFSDKIRVTYWMNNHQATDWPIRFTNNIFTIIFVLNLRLTWQHIVSILKFFNKTICVSTWQGRFVFRKQHNITHVNRLACKPFWLLHLFWHVNEKPNFKPCIEDFLVFFDDLWWIVAENHSIWTIFVISSKQQTIRSNEIQAFKIPWNIANGQWEIVDLICYAWSECFPL